MKRSDLSQIIGRFVLRHRPTLVISGALLMLGMYYTNDLGSVAARDELREVRAAVAEHRIESAERVQQQKELALNLELLQGSDTAIPAPQQLMITLGSLTDRAGQIQSELEQFTWAMVPGTTNPQTDPVVQASKEYDRIAAEVQTLLHQQPRDASILRNRCLAIFGELLALHNDEYMAGGNLELRTISRIQELQRQAKDYHLATSILFVLALLLTVISSLWKLDIPTGAPK
jgi:hypothetical protein